MICDKCGAEFDKKLGKATLSKAKTDPYGIFETFAAKTLTLQEWADIAFGRLKKESHELEEQIVSIKNKLADFIIDCFVNGALSLSTIVNYMNGMARLSLIVKKVARLH